jgi:trehalose-phosphatase
VHERDVIPREPSSRAVSTIHSALDHWDEVAALLSGRHQVVFLDFDGTLSPLVDEPDAAVLAPGIADAIDALARHATIAVISGRGADDVRARVGRDDIWIAGSHGFEIIGPDGERHAHPAAEVALEALDAAASALEAEIGTIRGVRIERKHLGLTVHDRMVADSDLGRVRRAADGEAARHDGVRVTHGKRVTELRPDVDWNKGRAVDWMIDRFERTDGVRNVPVYIGDDTTDEDAFVAIGERGVTIIVAAGGDEDRHTVASWSVEDPAQVRDVLDHLATIDDRRDPEHTSHVE